MPKELNSLDLEVKRMMLEYPDLFPSRLECLAHLFCVNGNGYEWQDGKLVDVCSTSASTPTNIEQASPYDFYINEDGTLEESEQVRMDYEATVRGFTETNIDYLSSTRSYLNSKLTFINVYPMSWGFCNMATAAANPLNVDQDWRDGIQEFIDWYLPEVNGKFGCWANDGPEPDTSRLDEATLNNFEICRKVQSMLITDNDRLHRKLQRRLMRKHLKRMNSELLKELAEEEK